jgi:hypothetical protein
MKHRLLVVLCLSFIFGGASVHAQTAQDIAAAAAEKEKALKNPYPNDLGPDKITDLSKYTPEQQEGYKLMQTKCSACHTPSRPLNSQFVDLKADQIAAFKKSNPEVFKDKLVWQIEDGVWQRYVKRMMAKPGCNISQDQGKKIFRFLVEYSKREKLGANTAKWKEHRSKLLAEFKQKHPDKYKELFEK